MVFSISHKCQKPRGLQLLFHSIYSLTVQIADQDLSREQGSESKLQVQPLEVVDLGGAMKSQKCHE